MDKGILKNVAINFTGLVLPTFISLVTVPTYIHLLGVERYGVISLVWTLIGYFGVLDFGMSIATENHISKARALNDKAEMARIFWSAFWLNTLTGVIGGLIIYFGGFIYTAYFTHVPPELRVEVYRALPWLAVAIPIANVSWVFAGSINGMERFGVFTTNQTIGTFMFQLIPLLAAWHFGGRLEVVLAGAVLARFLGAILLGRATMRVLDITEVLGPRLAMIRKLFSYGGWIVVAGLSQMVAETLDRLLLGTMMGARFVTYYTVPQNLVSRVNLLPMAFQSALFPRLSAAERSSADLLAQQSIIFLNAVFTPLVLAGMFAIGPFLHVWVGADVAMHATVIGRVLLIGIWFVGQGNLTRMLIQSQLNPATVTRVALFQLPIFAGVLWLAIWKFGMMGAAVAVAVRTAVDYGTLLYLSRIHARPIVFDVGTHLIFLVLGLIAGEVTQGIVMLAVLGVAFFTADAAWSLYTSPALRQLVRDGYQRFAPRFGLPALAERMAVDVATKPFDAHETRH